MPDAAQPLLDLAGRRRARRRRRRGLLGHRRTLARDAEAAGDFPRETENGSIGGLPSVSLTESLHPSFEPWFREQLPDVPFDGARAALALAAQGATVPFVARYRKEATGNLGEDALRRTAEAKDRFDRVVSRQAIIVESIERHAGLSDELRARILATFDPDALEDLYHPYRQQKNRALAAREAGLQPLADWIWDTGHGTETPQEGAATPPVGHAGVVDQRRDSRSARRPTARRRRAPASRPRA